MMDGCSRWCHKNMYSKKKSNQTCKVLLTAPLQEHEAAGKGQDGYSHNTILHVDQQKYKNFNNTLPLLDVNFVDW